MNVSPDDVEPEVALKADLLVVDDWKLIGHDDKSRRMPDRSARIALGA